MNAPLLNRSTGFDRLSVTESSSTSQALMNGERMAGMSTELVGNALCLDFANSVNQRADPRHDWLAEPDGLRRWAVLAGLPRPVRRPADDTVSAAVELREAVYRTFSAVAAGRPVIRAGSAADTARITGTCAEGLSDAALVTDPEHADDRAPYRLEWKRAGDPRRVLWAVADSALELLRHGPLDRVGECPACGWVFLDTSRNGRRRWCSMAMCGGAVKSARHYARTSGRATTRA
jgi:predicted RNA-binding Zn ribbon-like protein